MVPPSPHRRSWPCLRTPLSIYLIVMAPICGLMLFLMLTNTKSWMKWSAGVVLILTVVNLFKGYVRRLILTERSAKLVRAFASIEIPWSRVRGVGSYVPGGGVGATEYVYISTRETPPAGKWDIDRDTLQVQNQPGLIEAIVALRAKHDSMNDTREPVTAGSGDGFR